MLSRRDQSVGQSVEPLLTVPVTATHKSITVMEYVEPPDCISLQADVGFEDITALAPMSSGAWNFKGMARQRPGLANQRPYVTALNILLGRRFKILLSHVTAR